MIYNEQMNVPNNPLVTVIIPAYDEEQFLPSCLAAVERASRFVEAPVEVIVADNMSRDGTAAIAREWGARVVTVEERCLSVVRNRGAAAARGKYLVFIDADSTMSANFLEAVLAAMESGRYIGGGVSNIGTDRMSLGIGFSLCLLHILAAVLRISGVAFYTTREAFDAIGGFNEQRYAVEDIDFAYRLKRYGKRRGQRFKNLFRARVVTSTRKFDEFGDWHFIWRMPLLIGALLNRRQAAYELWYRPRR